MKRLIKKFLTLAMIGCLCLTPIAHGSNCPCHYEINPLEVPIIPDTNTR